MIYFSMNYGEDLDSKYFVKYKGFSVISIIVAIFNFYTKEIFYYWHNIKLAYREDINLKFSSIWWKKLHTYHNLISMKVWYKKCKNNEKSLNKKRNCLIT